jgi:hypothetical protein
MAHLLTSMREVCQHQGVMDFALLLLVHPHEGDAASFGAWIQLQGHFLHSARFAYPVPQPNNKGDAPMHHCPTACE